MLRLELDKTPSWDRVGWLQRQRFFQLPQASRGTPASHADIYVQNIHHTVNVDARNKMDSKEAPKKRITIRELAIMAKTTPATVSRALSGKSGISDSFRQKISLLAKEYAYVPNQFARTLQKGGSPFLGFLAADLMNPSYISIFRHLEAICRKEGFTLIIADSEQSQKLEREHVDYFLRLNVQGMFVFPVSDWNSLVSNEHLQIFSRNQIPMVALGHISRPGISTVVSEEKHASKQLIVELMKLSHTHFLIVAHDVASNIQGKIRLKSMREAISANPHGVLTDIIRKTASSVWKEQVIQAVTRAKKRPTAIVTINEYAALALYKPLVTANIRIPEDISLATCGTSNWLEDVAFPLTSCHVNIQEVARSAAALLFEKIANPFSIDRHVIIPQSIKIRESVAKCRV